MLCGKIDDLMMVQGGTTVGTTVGDVLDSHAEWLSCCYRHDYLLEQWNTVHSTLCDLYDEQ